MIFHVKTFPRLNFPPPAGIEFKKSPPGSSPSHQASTGDGLCKNPCGHCQNPLNRKLFRLPAERRAGKCAFGRKSHKAIHPENCFPPPAHAGPLFLTAQKKREWFPIPAKFSTFLKLIPKRFPLRLPESSGLRRSGQSRRGSGTRCPGGHRQPVHARGFLPGKSCWQ